MSKNFLVWKVNSLLILSITFFPFLVNLIWRGHFLNSDYIFSKISFMVVSNSQPLPNYIYLYIQSLKKYVNPWKMIMLLLLLSFQPLHSLALRENAIFISSTSLQPRFFIQNWKFFHEIGYYIFKIPRIFVFLSEKNFVCKTARYTYNLLLFWFVRVYKNLAERRL